MHLFVYYKFKPEAYPDVSDQASKLVAAVKQHVPGVRARLLRRPEPNAAGEHTWMETYEFDARHQRLLASTLSGLLKGSGLPVDRRVEWFTEVDSPTC